MHSGELNEHDRQNLDKNKILAHMTGNAPLSMYHKRQAGFCTNQ